MFYWMYEIELQIGLDVLKKYYHKYKMQYLSKSEWFER